MSTLMVYLFSMACPCCRPQYIKSEVNFKMNGKRPTRAQRELLRERCGLAPGNWLIQKNTPELLQIAHRHTGQVRVIKWKELWKDG